MSIFAYAIAARATSDPQITQITRISSLAVGLSRATSLLQDIVLGLGSLSALPIAILITNSGRGRAWGPR